MLNYVIVKTHKTGFVYVVSYVYIDDTHPVSFVTCKRRQIVLFSRLIIDNLNTEHRKFDARIYFRRRNVKTQMFGHSKKGKDKGKVLPITGHEGPEGKQMYSSTLPSSSVLDGGVWVVKATPRPLYPREGPGTHCIGGWVDPRSGLDGCRKSRQHRDSIPGQFSP